MRRWRLRSWSTAATVLVAATVVMLVWSLASAWTRPPLTPDSWAYLLLAKSFHSTPYHIPVIRQYQFHSDFGDSFPPVWPLILFVASMLMHAGPWLGTVVAALLSMALLPLLNVLLAQFVRAKGRRRVAAAACWATLLSTSPYLDEVLGGRSIPAAMVLYVVLAIALMRTGRPTLGGGLLAGAAAGLLWMTRFDAAPFVLVIGALYPIVSGSTSPFRWWLGYGVALAAMLTPWAVYSERTFGVAWATAPALMAKNIGPSLVMDWYPVAPRTIADDPIAWLSRVLNNVPGLASELWRVMRRYAYGTSLIGLFAGWAALQAGNLPARPARAQRVGLLLLFALVCQLAGPVIIGGFDLRYFSPLLTAVTLWSVGLLLNARTMRYRSMLLLPLGIGLLLGWRKALGVQRAQRASLVAVVGIERSDRWPDAAGASLVMLKRCLPNDARALVIEEGNAPDLVGYYAQRTALSVPDNWRALSDDDRRHFLDVFHVSHVIVGPGSVAPPADATSPVAGCAPLRAVVQRSSR